tara:strand:+ start:2054 stop:2260 length:207 start_codon:yes stop_codon:yes gene_type:complete
MKKLFVILSMTMFLFSCSDNKKTWEFTKEENEKNQGFNFEKSNYSDKDNSSSISNEHPGCTKSCCSKN